MDNTIFHPISIGVVKYRLVVFNRWGEKVFETLDINQGWDGYYHGQRQAQDVYVWRAEVTTLNGDAKVYSGDVTLIQ